MRFAIFCIVSLLAVNSWAFDSLRFSQSINPLPLNETELRVKTVYGATDGLATNQSQDAKGYHRATGSMRLSGTGIDTVTLNTDISAGGQDISFLNSGSYFGSVWVSDSGNNKTYKIRPIDGIRFEVISSDSTDTNTVNFQVEGE